MLSVNANTVKPAHAEAGFLSWKYGTVQLYIQYNQQSHWLLYVPCHYRQITQL